MLEFAIPIAPKGKERHRSMIRGGKIATYNTKKATAYEAAIREYVQSKYDGEPLEGPLKICISAYFQKPKSSKLTWHTVKPDADNIAKAICDSLNGVLWHDDKQIVFLDVMKSYWDRGEIVLRVYEL